MKNKKKKKRKKRMSDQKHTTPGFTFGEHPESVDPDHLSTNFCFMSAEQDITGEVTSDVLFDEQLVLQQS